MFYTSANLIGYFLLNTQLLFPPALGPLCIAITQTAEG